MPFIYGMLFGAGLACALWGYAYSKLDERRIQQDKEWNERIWQLRLRVNPWAKIQDYINALPEVRK